MFSEKLKTLRKQAGMTQEQFAQELHVSRQAVTKWETNVGVPDIGNLKAISALLQISLDELLDTDDNEKKKSDFLYESSTEYDIDSVKSYDIALLGAKRIVVSGYDGEKVKLRLTSNTIKNIASQCKVKIDDLKKRIDIHMNFLDGMNTTMAKESLFIFLQIPQQYAKNIELTSQGEQLVLQDIEIENMEFNGKASYVKMYNVHANVELNTNIDMEIHCEMCTGCLDVNQIAATSKVCIPMDMDVSIHKKGIANAILFQKDDVAVEDFSMQESEQKDNVYSIELNGMKSELTIQKCSPTE